MFYCLAVLALAAATKRSYDEMSIAELKSTTLRLAAHARIQGLITETSPEASIENKRFGVIAIEASRRLLNLLNRTEFDDAIVDEILAESEAIKAITLRATPRRMTTEDRLANRRKNHIRAQLRRRDAFDIIANYDHGRSFISDLDKVNLILAPLVTERPELLVRVNERIPGDDLTEKLTNLLAEPHAATLRARSAFNDLMEPGNHEDLVTMLQTVLATKTPLLQTPPVLPLAFRRRMPEFARSLVSDFLAVDV